MTRERPAGVQSPDTDTETGTETGPAAGNESGTETGARAGAPAEAGKGSGTGAEIGTDAGNGTGSGTEGATGTDTSTSEPAPAPVTLAAALAVPAVTLVTALFLLVGGMAIRAPESSGFLGPQFFPLTVGALLGVTACAAGVRAVLTVRRSPSVGTTGTPAAPASPEASGASAPPESTAPTALTGPTGSPETSAVPVASGPRAEAAAPAATGTDAATGTEGKGAHGDWRTLGIMAATMTAHVVLLQPLGWLLSGTLLFWGISFALDRRSPLLDLCVAVALAAIVQICFSGLLDVSLPSGLLGKVL